MANILKTGRIPKMQSYGAKFFRKEDKNPYTPSPKMTPEPVYTTVGSVGKHTINRADKGYWNIRLTFHGIRQEKADTLAYPPGWEFYKKANGPFYWGTGHAIDVDTMQAKPDAELIAALRWIIIANDI